MSERLAGGAAPIGTPGAASATGGLGNPADPGAPRAVPTADVFEGWLRDLRPLGLEATGRVERDGIAAWDVTLDGRRRRDLRTTLILDPALGLIAWAHLAPPLGDGLRKAYRTLLRWNDEFPLAKFSVADDGRPILAVEIPARWLDADELGLALARCAGVADHVFEETRGWLWIGGRVPDGYADRPIRTAALLDRYAARLGELVEPEPGTGLPAGPAAAASSQAEPTRA